MPRSFCPRLSEAKHLLPALRAQLAASASHRSLPINLALDLLPIVEDGLFGYEFVPNRKSSTYLTIGRDERGEPVLRRSLYCAAPPSTLRLAAVNGRFPSQHELDARYHIEQRDSRFPDWTTATEAAWAALEELFAELPRRPILIHDGLHQVLDAALAAACTRLAGRDPRIVFCGVPNEAQYGFALRDGAGERGQLVAWPPGRWELRWESPADGIRESWSAAPAACDTTGGWAVAQPTPHADMFPFGIPAAVDPRRTSRRVR